jgi:hypothetical protein
MLDSIKCLLERRVTEVRHVHPCSCYMGTTGTILGKILLRLLLSISDVQLLF